MGKGLFDLEKHFGFYGAYHSNPVNILIHTIFVWPLFYTSLILFHFTPPLLHLPLLGRDLNLGFAFALLYALFYLLLDRRAGALAAALCVLCWASSDSLAAHLGFSLAWKVTSSCLRLVSMFIFAHDCSLTVNYILVAFRNYLDRHELFYLLLKRERLLLRKSKRIVEGSSRKSAKKDEGSSSRKIANSSRSRRSVDRPQ